MNETFGEVSEIRDPKVHICPYCDFEDEECMFLCENRICCCPNCEDSFDLPEEDDA